MKQIVIKNFRKEEITALFVLFALSFILIEGLMIYALAEKWHIPSERSLYWILMLLYALVIGTQTVWFIGQFRKQICVTEHSVCLMSGKKVLRSIPKNQVIAFGVFSQREKFIPGAPFFCFATIDEINAIAQKYWHWRKRIYRKKQWQALEKSTAGMWTLQLSIYVYWSQFRLERNRNYLSANRITKEELHSIWELWQRKPICLGTMALYYPEEHL